MSSHLYSKSFNSEIYTPELLAPAGNLDKLKVAVLYGADAVYLAGQSYGMRASADNFSQTEIEQAVNFARHHGSKVYVVLNAFLHDEDFVGLSSFVGFLHEVKVAAVIVSDLGVIREVKRTAPIPIHLSTQSSCVNVWSAKLWAKAGIERLILGREVSLVEANLIREATNLEVELFIHGSMCMAYSGQCTISNFTAGRDSNRGGCIQSCRFNYDLKVESDNAASAHFMSSKDLNGARLVPEFISNKISSLKIEGRMKSWLYLASTVRAYRRVIDHVLSNQGVLSKEVEDWASAELQIAPHRDFTEASLENPAGADSIFDNNLTTTSLSSHQLLGLVLEANTTKILVYLHQSVAVGDVLELLPFKGDRIKFTVNSLKDVTGYNLFESRQDTLVWIDLPFVECLVEKYNIICVLNKAAQVEVAA